MGRCRRSFDDFCGLRLALVRLESFCGADVFGKYDSQKAGSGCSYAGRNCRCADKPMIRMNGDTVEHFGNLALCFVMQ